MNTKNKNLAFASRLQRILKDLGWSQSEMARHIGVTAQSVQAWCNGVTPRKDKIDKLAEVTGYPVHFFFMSEGDYLEESTRQPGKHNQDLTPQEQALLQLFRGLPESEKTKLINELKEKREHFDLLLKELLEARDKK
ncbi:helix-turn-helix domain-containing protein [Salmonella enterica subsp. enterica serovar Fufu]|uniref:helix-turn-helix domain-containing protein n=1 Tax=Salmonella enterica TaxID=28901 RepID=UPI0012CEAA7E|nr:helix-turn-helix domain-containing protein [Salmonella enterica]ECB3807396.1 helix-turn-helix domain-containing protein [Salmonella enterica subsp. enterica serovar Fufu]